MSLSLLMHDEIGNYQFLTQISRAVLSVAWCCGAHSSMFGSVLGCNPTIVVLSLLTGFRGQQYWASYLIMLV